MDNLANIVETLEERLGRLLEQHHQLKQDLSQLLQEKMEWQEMEQAYLEKVNALESKSESLKHANSILGSDQYNRETKRKVDALIREIDTCIMHLSE